MQMFQPLQYLQIDISNSYGLDKKTWNERLQWFKENEEHLEDLTNQAKEPMQFMAGCMAYRDALEGKPIGYMCGLDGTASGIQMLSVLTGCKTSASQCNLINTGRREDAYANLSNYMQEHVEGICYKDVKASCMTSMYGSTNMQKSLFSEKGLKVFYNGMQELFPGAWQLNQLLISAWNPDALSHDWVMPDGFDVHIKSIVTKEEQVQFMGSTQVVPVKVNAPKESSVALSAHVAHSMDGFVVREMGRRCALKPRKFQGTGTSTERKKDLSLLRILELFDTTKFMSAVVFEYMDRDNEGHLTSAHKAAIQKLVDTIDHGPFDLLAIHDKFLFHCLNGNHVRKHYANILAELAESNMLSCILTHLTGEEVKVTKLSNDLGKYIRRNDYAIT